MLIRTKGDFTRTVPMPRRRANAVVELPGKCQKKAEALELDSAQLARGVLLVGASRTGKSVQQGKMISQIRRQMSSRDVLIILDTKGEYAKNFYRPGDVILGTNGPHPQTDGWNLMRDCTAGCKTQSDLSQRIEMIASRIFWQKNNNVPYFTDAPRRVLEVLLETLLRHPDLLPEGEVLDNHGLMAFLQRGDYDRFIACSSAPAEMRSYIGTSKNRNPTERSVLAELLINVRMQLCGAWGAHGNFSLVQFETNRKGKTLFLQYDLRDGGASDPVYQLLIDLLLTGLMNGQNSDGKFYLFLDEIHLLGKSPQILEKALNYGPGIGLGTICIGTQSLSQLEELSGDAGMNTLLSGLQTRIMFRTEDRTSRDFVREQCGSVRTTQLQYIPGISYNAQDGAYEPAVSDIELSFMEVGQAIVKLPEYPAFFFQFDQ